MYWTNFPKKKNSVAHLKMQLPHNFQRCPFDNNLHKKKTQLSATINDTKVKDMQVAEQLPLPLSSLLFSRE